jgi:transposase
MSELETLKQEFERLKQENERLRDENKLLKLQLDEFKQKFFKKNTPKPEEDQPSHPPKKRGAPLGHQGKTRPVPDHFDQQVDVELCQCPECGGKDLSACNRHEDHYQEDIVLPQVKVTRFRHHYYWCRGCHQIVCGVGNGELPGSYIGPVAKSLASFLHYQMKLPYRKIRLLFRDVFHMTFTPSAAPGFDRQIRCRGDPLYQNMLQSLPAQRYVHADETGWRNEGVNHWLWCFIAKGYALYRIDRSRSGKVVTAVLGKRYAGTLISDFLGAYNRIRCRKQRCLVHLLRLIKKWLVYFAGDRKRRRYFETLKSLVKSIILLSKQYANGRPRNFVARKADLLARLRKNLNLRLGHPRADKFIRKLSAKRNQLVACLDFPEVCAHNNIAERCLRDNVIMRKITFGNRSFKHSGQRNHEVIMSLIQTARMQNLNPLTFLHTLLTHPATASAALRPALSSGR